MAHQKVDTFVCFVSHQLTVSDTSLFPLVISESVKLDAKLENTFETFCASLDSNFWQINLKRNVRTFKDFSEIFVMSQISDDFYLPGLWFLRQRRQHRAPSLLESPLQWVLQSRLLLILLFKLQPFINY